MVWYSDPIGSAINAFDQRWENVSDAVSEWSDAAQAKMGELNTSARNFQIKYRKLKKFENTVIDDPILQNEYNDLMNQGAWIDKTLTTFLGEPDMGIVPAIGVIAILGIISAWLVAAGPLLEQLEKTISATTTLVKTLTPVAFLGAFIYFWPDIKRKLK